jgi:hypothetical protein
MAFGTSHSAEPARSREAAALLCCWAVDLGGPSETGLAGIIVARSGCHLQLPHRQLVLLVARGAQGA